MKTPIIIVFAITLFFTSCKDSNTSENDSKSQPDSEEQINSEKKIDEMEEPKVSSEGIPNDNEDSDIDQKPASTVINKDKPTQEIQTSNLSGSYMKLGGEIDNSCMCYCININYSGNPELCLTPSKIFINTRMSNLNNRTTNIYLVNPSSKNSGGKDIPWDKFDKNTPIATITSKGNGEIELDWLGFSINGDLAIDYAILGKKTLEGNYKKK